MSDYTPEQVKEALEWADRELSSYSPVLDLHIKVLAAALRRERERRVETEAQSENWQGLEREAAKLGNKNAERAYEAEKERDSARRWIRVEHERIRMELKDRAEKAEAALAEARQFQETLKSRIMDLEGRA